MKSFLVISLLCLTSVAVSAQWIKQNVNTTAGLRGLSVVNEKVVWASGTGGTVIRTINGGEKWDVITVPGAEKLDFRDIEAFDGNTAYILSIGNGDSSRIYKTTDGGKSWELQFQNTNERAFFDAIACRDGAHCTAVSDPVDGHFLMQVTYDGKVWEQFAGEMPTAEPGEAAFAASGTCLIVARKSDAKSFGRLGAAFLVTGGAAARVLKAGADGPHYHIATTPIQRGKASQGIFSIAMFDDNYGVIVGGDYEKPDEHTNNLALTRDSGKTWELSSGLSGYRSGVTYVNKNIIVAVGTNGSDASYDGGKTWSGVDKENYNAVQSKGLRATWAVGPKGRVAYCPILQLQKTRESRRSN